MSTPGFYLLSLGCAKNTVDSHAIATTFKRVGYRICDQPEEAEIILVNTCGFIGPAKQESISELKRLAKGKQSGQILIAAGCLTQREGEQVVVQVPEIDGVIGTRHWMEILQLVQQLRERRQPTPVYHIPEVSTQAPESPEIPRIAIQGPSAYLKISEGCRRPCAFCAIPLIKGTAISRPYDAILRDAHLLQTKGVREINLIAQDTSDYGHDLGMTEGLATLLEGMVNSTPDVDWIRVLYTYPGAVSDRLIEMMATSPQILPYLDLPLQHAHPAILRSMRRPANVEWVYRTIEKARSAVPDITLRTTFIVGYPGETEQEFQTLLDFVTEMRFDRVGVFSFSFEPGTPSEPLGDPVEPEVKQDRYDRLMTLQQKISLEKHMGLVGQTLQVLLEGHGDGISLGRSVRDAPEVDGMVIMEGEFPIGEMMPVRITGAMPYDLTGEVLKPKSSTVER